MVSELAVDEANVALLVVVKVSVNVPEVELILSAPVVWVNPFEAVKSPAEVIVPDPVAEILLEVEMVLAVAMVPKPEAIDPEARAPTVVIDDWPT